MNYTKYTLLLAATVLFIGCDLKVTVNAGGRVISSPSGIDCRINSGNCEIEDYAKRKDHRGKIIGTFRAIPDQGYVLKEWRGDCKKIIANNCYALLDGGDVDIEAVFVPIDYDMTAGQTDKRVSFIAIGDSGTGSPEQYAVGDAIGEYCEDVGCDFVIGAGDNFYGGSPESVDHPFFQDKFEKPYANVDLEFNMVLGNHDTGRLWLGDKWGDGDGGDQSVGETQVDYHDESDKWYMPSRYYHRSWPLADESPLLDLYALDTPPLVSGLEFDPKYNPFRYGDEMGEWLAQQLHDNSGDWKIAFGHHMYISNGPHNNAGNYEGLTYALGAFPIPFLEDFLFDTVRGEILKDWMEEYLCDKVDLYISGHDHNMQALPPVAPCGRTEHMVSGAGAKTTELKHADDNQVHFQISQEGFIHIEIVGNELTMRFHTVTVDGAGFERQEVFSKTIRKKVIQDFSDDRDSETGEDDSKKDKKKKVKEKKPKKDKKKPKKPKKEKKPKKDKKKKKK